MYCKNCGTKLSEGAHFCFVCGTKVNVATSTPSETFKKESTSSEITVLKDEGKKATKNSIMDQRKTEKNPMKKWGIPIVLIAVIVLIASFFLKGPNSKKGANSEKELIEESLHAVYHGDLDKLMTLMPEPYLDYLDEWWGCTREELDENFSFALDIYNYHWNLEKGWTYKYNVTGNYELNRQELKDFNNQMREDGVNNFHMSAAKKLEVEVDIYNAYGEYYSTDSWNAYIAKYDNRWYLIWGM